MIEKLRQLHVDTVILFGSWTFYLPPSSTLKEENLSLTVAKLAEAGVKRVIVLGPAPRWEPDLPKLLAQRIKDNLPMRTPLRMHAGLMSLSKDDDTVLARMAGNLPGVEYFSTFDSLCTADGCLALIKNSPEGLTTFDYGHLTTEGAEVVAKQLFKAFPMDPR